MTWGAVMGIINSSDFTKEYLENLTNKEIMKIEGLDQFSRLYLVCVKYGKNILKDATLKSSKLIFKGASLSLHNKQLFKIEIIERSEDENVMIVEATARGSFLDTEFAYYASASDGGKIIPEVFPYEKTEIMLEDGKMISKGISLRFELPVARNHIQSEYSFFVSIDENDYLLDPVFDESTGVTSDISDSFAEIGNNVIRYSNRALQIADNNEQNIQNAKAAFLSNIEEVKKEDSQKRQDLAVKWENMLKIRDIVNAAELKNRVAFISTRSSDRLMGNMQHVFDHVKAEKVAFYRAGMQSDPDAVLECAELMYTSKVIVTDDYLFLLRNFGKAKGQKVVQLWHATGALKGFGQQGSKFYPKVDAKYHKDYDLVTVAAEGERKTFAWAMKIDVDKVRATGIARTDELFDDERRKAIPAVIYKKYPQLRGKEVVVYAPTFRELPGRGKNLFEPELDFRRLSSALNEDQILVICPHPVMTEPILKEHFDNIIEVRDIITADMMYVTDLLITDYSSVAIEFSVFDKPMIFYCYDLDTYERGVFMDYENELPGKVITEQEDLIHCIKMRSYEDNAHEKIAAFRDKYLGACDGHSSERIASIIDKMVLS